MLRQVLRLLILLIAAGGASTGTARGQQSVSAESAGLNVSLPAAKRLAGARALIELREWDGAIDALQQISTEFGDALIETEPGRLMNVHDACSAELARLPPAGLARLRERIDPPMRSLFRDALRLQSNDRMRQVVDGGFASSYGDDALAWLAEHSWIVGDFDSARALWTMLLPLPESGTDEAPLVLRYPDADLDAASIRARLVLCSIMQRDQRAVRELAAFRQMHPQASGRLAARDGLLADILDAVWQESANWQRLGRNDWPMPGGAPDRRGVAPHAPQLDELRWQTALTSPRLPLIERQRLALPEFGAAWCWPLVWNGAVLINDADTVRALNLQTGRPMWPSGVENDDGAIYSSPLLTAALTMPTAGVPRFSAVVADGRYYARMGLPVATAAAAAIQTPPSQLICLDLEHAEGRLLWAAEAGDVLDDPGWSFSGAPLVIDERLYVPLRRSTPQLEIGMACLSATSGESIWELRICSALQQAPELYHLVDHDLLALAAGLVYCETGAGVVAAVDADSGTLRWATTYPSIPATAGEQSDPAQRRLSLPVYSAGQLFVAPRDSDRLMSLDAATGATNWSVPAPGTITSLVGVANETLIAGGDQLWAIDAQTGRRRRPPIGFSDPAGHGFGQGALAGPDVLWTTRTELFIVDLESWTLRRRIPLTPLQGTTGGNLVVAGAMLLIAQPDALTALGPSPAQSNPLTSE